MQTWLVPYAPTVFAMLATATLLVVQILILDLASIKAKHAPGTPVLADHASFLFRASRAHGNTNESVAVFILLCIAAVFTSSSPTWTNACAWLYVAGRLGHMLCYYADLRLARSIAFTVSLIALISLLLVTFAALL
ncbi:MAG: MAPEG family protein [Pseudomonadota bacterium]